MNRNRRNSTQFWDILNMIPFENESNHNLEHWQKEIGDPPGNNPSLPRLFTLYHHSPSFFTHVMICPWTSVSS